MALRRPFPTRGVLRRPPIRPVDLLVAAGILALLYVLLRLGRSMTVGFLPTRASQQISTDPANLPYYAARSLLRMFIALAVSVAFTLVYGTAAARSRRAEELLIPLLDILQSVPILGFLSVTVTAVIALFPGSLLGLECASIFAIFTSQAWNLTFSFYHSLLTQPRDLDEAARMLRLTKWQRFWRLDVPGSMIGLVWNGMMSFGGGWFFLAASLVLDLLCRSSIPHALGTALRPVGRALDRATRPFGLAEHPLRPNPARQRAGDLAFWAVVIAVAAWGGWQGLAYLDRTAGLDQFPHALRLGAVTFARVLILVVASTLVWVPVGVRIGLDPRLARYAQPIVQVLASFPANFLFPFATVAFLALGLSLNVGGILLMSLGAQWYVLFNAIAGAMAIPTDLREAMDAFAASGSGLPGPWSWSPTRC